MKEELVWFLRGKTHEKASKIGKKMIESFKLKKWENVSKKW